MFLFFGHRRLSHQILIIIEKKKLWQGTTLQGKDGYMLYFDVFRGQG
jgi:hypothetical protein